jgi:NAD(P)-dependent dehydrogenase (short-subunit alcohol dehydrogenase family)
MNASLANSPLSDQVAVITGAGRGIGRAIALKLAALGAHTVLCGRSRDALAETAAAIAKGGSASGKDAAAPCTIVECDITDLRSVEALAQQVERTFQRLDILVNNAGISGPSGPLQPARRLLLHSQFCPAHDQSAQRTHHQYLVACGQESAAQPGGLCRLEVGIERADLRGGRRDACA